MVRFKTQIGEIKERIWQRYFPKSADWNWSLEKCKFQVDLDVLPGRIRYQNVREYPVHHPQRYFGGDNRRPRVHRRFSEFSPKSTAESSKICQQIRRLPEVTSTRP